MPASSSVLFASSNGHKFAEAREILAGFGIDAVHFPCDIEEVQSDDIETIAGKKSVAAFGMCQRPVIVEDAALHIEALGGFPGPYSSYIVGTLGNGGILRLVGQNRKATFTSVVSYCDRTLKPRTFRAQVPGTISREIRGQGWGYDPIFIPNGRTETYAQIPDKNQVSHRYAALRSFATWSGTRESSDR